MSASHCRHSLSIFGVPLGRLRLQHDQTLGRRIDIDLAGSAHVAPGCGRDASLQPLSPESPHPLDLLDPHGRVAPIVAKSDFLSLNFLSVGSKESQMKRISNAAVVLAALVPACSFAVSAANADEPAAGAKKIQFK